MARTNRTRARATAPASAAADAVMDLSQAIAALKTTRPTFYRWLKSGAISGLKAGRQWRFRREDIDRFLDGQAPKRRLAADPAPLLAALRKQAGVAAVRSNLDPMQEAVDLTIAIAIKADAPDLCVTATADGAVIQLRSSGTTLSDPVAVIDRALAAAYIDCWKTMARLTDGGVERESSVSAGDGRPALIVRRAASVYGDCLTVMIEQPPFDAIAMMDHLGLAVRDLALLERALAGPFGFIAVAGATGSGKTTMQYACLGRLLKDRRRVATVEEGLPSVPVPRLARLRVDRERGPTHADCLRDLMRLMFDGAGVDDLHDHETVATAAACSALGMLVVATLKAADSIRALRRVASLAGGDESVLDELSLVTAQRLVVRICGDCASPWTPPAPLLAAAERIATTGGVAWSTLKPTWKRGRGCERCEGRGTRGRAMAIEMMEVTPDIRRALRTGAGDDEIRAIAIRHGLTTMAADAVRRAAQGNLALDQVVPTFADVAGLGELA